ncbi:MAG: hypothetical protein ACYSX0_22370, partial [Planctomycetota bacterium]
FVLRDDEGRLRGGLWLTDDDDVALELGTNTGHARLRVTPEGHASLDLGLGKHRLRMLVKEMGKAGIYISNHEGVERASVEVETARAHLNLTGRRSAVFLSGDESSVLVDGDKTGIAVMGKHGRVGLSLDKRWACISSWHRTGQNGVRLECRPNGLARISLWDLTERGGFFTRRDHADDESLRVALGLQTGGLGELKFFENAGKVIWKAPGE